jgi:hypothetical protein
VPVRDNQLLPGERAGEKSNFELREATERLVRTVSYEFRLFMKSLHFFRMRHDYEHFKNRNQALLNLLIREGREANQRDSNHRHFVANPSLCRFPSPHLPGHGLRTLLQPQTPQSTPTNRTRA